LENWIVVLFTAKILAINFIKKCTEFSQFIFNGAATEAIVDF
jgi:hypothetical protein